MHRFNIWIHEHKYLAGGLVLGLVLLWFVLKRSAGATAPSTQALQSTGPSQQLQAAQLQAEVANNQISAAATANNNQLQAAIAAKQIDATVAQDQTQAQKDVALASIQGDYAKAIALAGAQVQASNNAAGSAYQQAAVQAGAAVSIAGIQTTGAVDVARIQGQTNVSLAGIQAGVQQAGIAAQLAAQLDVNRAGIEITRLNTTRDITVNDQNTNRDIVVNQSNNTTALGLRQLDVAGAINLATINAGLLTTLSHDQLAGLINTNQTGVIINQSNNDLARFGIQTQGSVLNNLITTSAASTDLQTVTQGQIDLARIGVAQSTSNGILDLIRTGRFNLGGQGGANNVAVATTLLGNPVAGVAAVTSNPGLNWGQIIGGIGNAFGAVFGTPASTLTSGRGAR